MARAAPAIVAVSRDGSAVARRLGAAFPGATVWLPARFAFGDPEVAVRSYTGPVRDVIAAEFRGGRDLIVVAALGIVVRSIAPHLGDKLTDPAVVAVDDLGRFAIPVIGGHAAAANAIAGQAAEALGGQAIVTTSSEIHGIVPLDRLGVIEGWQRLATKDALRLVAAAAVNRDPVGVYQSAGSRRWRSRIGPVWVQEFAGLEALAHSGLPAIAITERAIPAALADAAAPRWIVYHPPVLAVGVGCSRGAPAAEIEAALSAALQAHGLSPAAIATLATIEIKRDEVGLIAVATARGLPIQFFSAAELAAVDCPNPSEIVRQAVGTPGVCEPAARLAAGGGPLIVAKRGNDQARVAIARIECDPRPADG